MRTVRFTTLNDRDIYVVPEHVVYVTPDADGTAIHFASKLVLVRDPLGEVLDALYTDSNH